MVLSREHVRHRSDRGARRRPVSSAALAEAFERHRRFISPTFVRVLDLLGYGRLFVRAEGTRLWDVDDKEYLDLLSGCGSVALGYNHPAILASAEASLRAHVPSFVQVAPGLE